MQEKVKKYPGSLPLDCAGVKIVLHEGVELDLPTLGSILMHLNTGCEACAALVLTCQHLFKVGEEDLTWFQNKSQETE